MRTSFITINNKDYMLAMSNRVLVELENRGSSIQEFLSDDKHTITNICWLIIKMSEAGSAYAKLADLGEYQPLTQDEILDASGSDDYEKYMDAILKAAGVAKVQAEPPKNVEGTHEEAQDG